MSAKPDVSPWLLLRLLAAGLALVMLLAACSNEPSVEQQIIAGLESMEEAAEAGKPLDFMGHVAKSFKGQQGMLERTDFQRFMLLQMNENRRLSANFFPIKVVGIPELAGEAKANASFRLLVTGGQGLLPERGQLFDVETEWIREGGRWLLLRADWEAVQIIE